MSTLRQFVTGRGISVPASALRDIRFVMTTVVVALVLSLDGLVIRSHWAALLSDPEGPLSLLLLIAAGVTLFWHWLRVFRDRSALVASSALISKEVDSGAAVLRLYRGLFLSAMLMAFVLKALDRAVC